MHRTRLHIAGPYTTGTLLPLDAERSRYLGRVLRMHIGDDLRVFDGEGSEYAATIAELQKSSATLEVGNKQSTETESSLRLHLVQGISRGERMDFAVQKATELGVKRITPVLTEYGVVKLDEARAAKRRDHWQKVAASACEQSGRTRLPLVDTPITLKKWFGDQPAETDKQLILKPGAKALMSGVGAPNTKVCLLIGPEGGFSEIEYEDAECAGFQAVSLGPRVLRTETAAIAALAILQSLWGDLGAGIQA